MRRNNRRMSAGECLLIETPEGVQFSIDAWRFEPEIEEWLDANFAGLRVQMVNTHNPKPDVPMLVCEFVAKLPTMAEILAAIDHDEIREFSGQAYVSGTYRIEDHGTDKYSSHWEPIVLEPGDSASYGDFKRIHGEPQWHHWYVPSRCSGSDYGTSDALEVANHRAFLEYFQTDETMVAHLYGDFGTFGLAVRLDSLTHEMLDCFAGLDDYPVIDEQTLCEVEHESENEAWDSWVRSDFTRDAVKALSEEPRYTVESYLLPGYSKDAYTPSYSEWRAYGDRFTRYQVLDHEAETITGKPAVLASGFVDYESAKDWMLTNTTEPNWTEDHLEDLFQQIGDKLRGYFEELASAANEYWYHETGNNAGIHYDQFLNRVTIEGLEELAWESNPA